MCGTLSYSSCNNNPEFDWLAIAKLLVEHGMPGPESIEDASDPCRAECVRIARPHKTHPHSASQLSVCLSRYVAGCADTRSPQPFEAEARSVQGLSHVTCDTPSYGA